MVIAYDPTWPVETHLHADACDGEIAVPLVWRQMTGRWKSDGVDFSDAELHDHGHWRCVLDDTELAAWVVAGRDALKLPITGIYREVAEETQQQLELALTLRQGRRRATRDFRPSDWSPERFRAEVEALCGRGVQKGRAWWMRCPWHEDKDPSLEVDFDKRIWHCWGCDAKGGHKEWRLRSTRRV